MKTLSEFSLIIVNWNWISRLEIKLSHGTQNLKKAPIEKKAFQYKEKISRQYSIRVTSTIFRFSINDIEHEKKGFQSEISEHALN